MEEKLLLSVGVVFVLFGVIGVCAVGFAYYYTKPYLNGLSSDIEQIFSIANQTTDDAASVVFRAANSIGFAVIEFNSVNIPFIGNPFRAVANSVNATAYSLYELGIDVRIVNEYMETWRNSILGEISLILFTVEISFVWIGVLHALFIMMGASILWIRKSLQSVINRNKT